MEVWVPAPACPPYTAWFSLRTNCTRLCPTWPLGSRFALKTELETWSAKWFSTLVWPPAQQERVGVFGTGWEGGAVGRPRLHPAKLPKVRVVRVLKVREALPVRGEAHCALNTWNRYFYCVGLLVVAVMGYTFHPANLWNHLYIHKIKNGCQSWQNKKTSSCWFAHSGLQHLQKHNECLQRRGQQTDRTSFTTR